MPAAYILIEAKVHDPVAYEQYKQLAAVAIEKYQARFLVRGGNLEVLEGSWTKPERLVIIEFASEVQAKAFYNSPEYSAAREARKEAASFNMLLAEGV